METISLPFAQLIIQILGLPGLIFIIWVFDQKRFDKQRELYKHQSNLQRISYEEQQRLLREVHEKETNKYREQVMAILVRYEKDITSIKTFYDNNVHLVQDYEKLSRDLVDTVRLNTQAQQMLCDYLKNKTPCVKLIGAGGDR